MGAAAEGDFDGFGHAQRFGGDGDDRGTELRHHFGRALDAGGLEGGDAVAGGETAEVGQVVAFRRFNEGGADPGWSESGGKEGSSGHSGYCTWVTRGGCDNQGLWHSRAWITCISTRC